MNNLTDVPEAGTPVVRAGTARRGSVTGDGGRDHWGRKALVRWEGADGDELVYVHFLALDQWTPRGEPADIGEDDA
jgi:hypothetical protein